MEALASEPQDMAQVNGSHKILVCHAKFFAASRSKMPTHAKDKVPASQSQKIKENKKETKIIILMGKKCAKTTEKSAGKSSLACNLEIELFTFSFYSFLWLE